MERSDFDELLHRYLTGQVTESERVRIEAWLDVMKSGRGNDLELSQPVEEKIFEKITRRVDNCSENPVRAGVFNSFALRSAAALLLLLAFTYFLRSCGLH